MLAVLLTSVLAILGHLPSITNGFVIDDFPLLVHNPHVRTLRGLFVILRSDLFVASAEPRAFSYYRPLSGLSYWVTWQAFGDNPTLHHVFNLGLHAVVVGCFTHFMIRSGLRIYTSMLAASLFAIHPATADIVAYLGGRQDLLGWVTIFVSAILILRCKNFWAQASVAFFGSLCAGFFREYFWIAPLLFFGIFELISGERQASSDSSTKEARRGNKQRAWVLVAGILAVLVSLGIRNVLGIGQLVNEWNDSTMVMGCVGSTALRLIHNTVAPTDLALNVSCTPLADTTAWLLLGGGALVLLAPVVWLAKTNARTKAVLACAGVFIMASGAVIHGFHGARYGVISDRYTYSFLVGALLFAASLTEHVHQRFRLPARAKPSLLRPLVPWILLATPLSLLPLTWARDHDWKSDTTVEIAMWRDRPHDPESQYAEALRLIDQGDYEAAYPLCVAYRNAAPQAERASLCIAGYLYLKGRAEEAVPLACHFARTRPGNVQGRHLCLSCLLATGRAEEATALISDWKAMFGESSEMIEAQEVLQRMKQQAPAP